MPKTQKQPIVKSRKGWDKAFHHMHEHCDDVLDLAAFEKRAKERSRPFGKVLEGLRAAEKGAVVSHSKAMAELDKVLNANSERGLP